MLRFFWLTLIIAVVSSGVQAQRYTGFVVVPGAEGWNIVHKVEKGETVFMLARRYHVPPAILADANGLTYSDGLKDGSSILIPLGAYNMLTMKPVNAGESRALYYKVRPEDNLYRISRHTAVPQRTLAQWNNMAENEVRPGQTLLVGWIMYDATQLNAPPPVAAAPVRNPAPSHPAPVAARQPDTPKYILPPATQIADNTDNAVDTETTPPPATTIEELFKEQTQNGQNIVWEKGSAAFFSLSGGAAKGAAVFAFHNKAAKGAVVRVKNMNNGRIIFVKVLGPLPLTKQYYNCIIGLSSSAKAALGVWDNKTFCELSYAGY